MENNQLPAEQLASQTSQSLPPGYKLDEYVIEKEIGAGGFGVTYKAHDKQLDRYVAIKEYFPFNLALRENTMHVVPKTRVAQDVDEYTWGLSRFVQEARALALFQHPNIIRVIRYIERNSTAYIIMDFADGRDVSDVLQTDGPLSVEKLKTIILPIAEGLVSVHSADMLHRDIKPGNIRIKGNGAAVLIDFGAARQAIGILSQSISTILTPGYAPIEQYSSRGNQGPWTDLYALAAVGYVCLTKENLSHYEATERIRNDQLPRLVDRIEGNDKVFLSALDWALRPEETDRPQTVSEWLTSINSRSIPSKDTSSIATKRLVSSDKFNVPKIESSAQPTDGLGSKKPFNVVVVVVVFGLIASGVMFFMATDLNTTAKEDRVVMNSPSLETTEAASIPKGTSIDEVKDQAETPENNDLTQDDHDFKMASRINTAEGYKLYRRLHPEGKHLSKLP